MELLLGHREVDDMVDQTLCRRRPEDTEELQKWVRKDKTARMTIGLTLSDEMLENVSHTTTALDVWLEICNVYLLEIDISEMRSQDTCNTHVCKLSHSTHM